MEVKVYRVVGLTQGVKPFFDLFQSKTKAEDVADQYKAKVKEEIVEI
jgi:hypothetical protein